MHIYYSETDYVEVELARERGYYDDLQFDEDADDYEEKVNEHIKDMLTPKTEPIVIYINNRFIKLSCAEKYRTLIESEINQRDKTWSEITKIVKVEKRQER